MKRTISIITFLIFIIMTLFMYIGEVNATIVGEGRATKVDLDVETNKTIVKPGEEVKVLINFGENLRTYKVNIAYDNNIFEYMSAEGGTATDMSDKINVVFEDTTGGSAARNNMSVTFKAKENITTSNPTEFTVTAENLTNADGSVTFEDITTPIVKNVTVEPEYVDYKITLNRPDTIIKGKETEMTISYSSSMGRYYEHARLIAEATTPAGATVKLLGTDPANLEHDIIQSGWGDAQGYKIGGKDVEQVLKVRGLFSDQGTYSITLTLIDRDNSDRAIASTTSLITVSNAETGENDNQETPASVENPANNLVNNTSINASKTPNKLPKTGSNIYIPVVLVIVILMMIYVYNNKKNEEK